MIVRLRRQHVLGIVALALLGMAAATAAPARVDTSQACNSRLKGLKTLSDPQRNLVNLSAKSTTVAVINALPQPHPTPATRSTDFERHVWRVTAQITEFRLEADSDIHLILFDAGAYLIAEMPAAHCVPATARDRTAIIAARKKFATSCGQPTTQWQPLGAVAEISGVGFFDIPHSQKPHASNFAELHPVTGIEFVSGCGA
jgi:hypothetical protein